MKETKLLPCPFCGHKASVYHVPYTSEKFNPTFSVKGFGSLGYNTTKTITKYAIKCNKCKATMGAYSTQKSAEQAWNRRATDERAD